MAAPMSSKVASDAEHTNLPVVRTLKPPPEIWELVHPVESKQFNPRVSLRYEKCRPVLNKNY